MLGAWLHGIQDRESQWAALDALGDCDAAERALLLHRLASIIERNLTWKLQVRRRAAIALLHLARGAPPESEQLQQALARSLALALPRRLGTPRLVQ